MRAVAFLPALSLIAGAVGGGFTTLNCQGVIWLLPWLCIVAAQAWRRSHSRATCVVLAAGFCVAGAALGARDRERATRPTLRAQLEEWYGGFAMDTLGPEGDHDPIAVRALLTEDAAVHETFTSLRVRVVEIARRDGWQPVDGGVSLTVGGEAAGNRTIDWRAGRIIEAPVTFRRPARYLNDGVSDFERDLALDGITLFASAKSALLVTVVANGSRREEYAASLRAHVRGVVGRRITPRNPTSGAVVTAVLIGDRTALPEEVRDRLQAAGTYHVIAISGGNIAILAGLVLGTLTLASVPGRLASLIAIVTLLAYSEIATSGPSVWRATLMAVLYLAARLQDHRTAPWQAISFAAAVMVVAHPLDVRDAGFLLTFGATAALLEGARRGRAMLPKHRAAAWLVASLAASFAVEIALLPVSAQTFSRVTTAGLLLNLLAVPMMGVAQVAGIAAVALDSIDMVAEAAAWVATAAATLLVESARLVDEAPWLTSRVPPPGMWLIAVYYGSLAVALYGGRPALRTLGAVTLVGALLLTAGLRPTGRPAHADGFRLTMFDVGQGEAMLVDSAGKRLQIDAGGIPFGGGGFDIGARVLAPALWARGVRAIDTLLVTHGDPDHIGGARVLLDVFQPRQLWEGIVVPRHEPTRALREDASRRHADVGVRRAGETFAWSGVRIRILHPDEPDWERPRVRNDDSVVLEVSYGEVAFLFTGDIGAGTERAIVPHLTPARTRILKVAHHGSRTSTSRELLDAWRPQIALISAGRGNTFGHPAPEVLRGLESIGARVFRTDLDGEITVETDGRQVRVRTFRQEHRFDR